MTDDDEALVAAMRERARIRRSIPRGNPDRISDQLEAAAKRIVEMSEELDSLYAQEAGESY